MLTVVASGLWDYGLHFVSSLSFLNIDYDKYLLSIMCCVLNDGVKAKKVTELLLSWVFHRSLFIFLIINVKYFCNEINIVNI